MKLLLQLVLGLTVVTACAALASGETTLEKVNRTGILTVGTRTGSPPFAFVDRKNQWVGFSIDLVEQAILPVITKKIGKQLRLEKKETTPQTRIPLLISKAVDLVAETMTDTRARRESVDFSLTFFVTGAQFLVRKNSPIKGIESIAGKRIAAQQGATNARILRERVPGVKLREFPDQPAAFQALVQGQVDAYTNDGVQLAGLKAKSSRPEDWKIAGNFYSYEPYGMALRKNESDFRNLVAAGLMEAIESGNYFKLYDKWFGPKGEAPYPLAPEVRRFLQMEVVPK